MRIRMIAAALVVSAPLLALGTPRPQPAGVGYGLWIYGCCRYAAPRYGYMSYGYSSPPTTVAIVATTVATVAME